MKSSIVMNTLYYPPTQPAKTQESLPVIPDRIIQLAKNSGGEFIHKNGQQIYRWSYDKMYYADYDGSGFGSWFLWTDEQLPVGELKEL
jgi:hypothetical protein